MVCKYIFPFQWPTGGGPGWWPFKFEERRSLREDRQADLDARSGIIGGTSGSGYQ
jgi:hypothetical protein